MSSYLIEKKNQQVRIILEGDLLANQVPELQLALKEALGPDVRQLIFNLDKTVNLDSSGIGLLIAASNSMSSTGGAVQVINVSPEIMKLLQSMRLAGRLHAGESDREEARHG